MSNFILLGILPLPFWSLFLAVTNHYIYQESRINKIYEPGILEEM